MLVGDDGQSEGSYGMNGMGVERCESALSSASTLPQSLGDRCDAGPLSSPCSVLFQENFESGAPGWTHAPRDGADTWHLARSSLR